MESRFKVCFFFTRIFKPKKAELPADIKEAFDKYSDNGIMTEDKYQQFLVEYQGDSTANNLSVPQPKKPPLVQPKHLTLVDFHRRLFSAANSPIRSQDHGMNAPISHYFIFTGHNSYLTGNQLTSRSSTKPIIKALKQGVRAIELDLWPNSKYTDVKVYHGWTLTPSVKLRNCLKAIRHYAFHASEYPVIITFEDHLTEELRDKVARMVEETLGDTLYKPKQDDFSELPSPDKLKRKIIISTKPPDESTESNAVDDKRGPMTKSPAVKVRCLKKKDASDIGHEQQNEDVEDGVPRYRDLIAVHARKHKGDLEHSLHIKPDKGERLSLSEQQLVDACKEHGKQIVRFTQKNLLRVYPKGTRIDSSNYSPFDGWKHGAQMVAFNMQGNDEHLWCMQGLFRANRGCGYVKKPDILLQDPNSLVLNPVNAWKTLKVKVYMGEGWHSEFHHAHFDCFSPPDFYVKVGIAGFSGYSEMERTRKIDDNWIPVWDEEFEFPIMVPELTLLRIEVGESDTGKKHDFGGQTCLPVSELRSGIRCVPLCNKKGEQYKFVKLLMGFQFI